MRFIKTFRNLLCNNIIAGTCLNLKLIRYNIYIYFFCFHFIFKTEYNIGNTFTKWGNIKGEIT